MSDKIVVNNLYKVFGSHPERAFALIERGLDKDRVFEQTGLTIGVHDASFSVRTGEIFVVMGLSGSGKSTLLRMLNRLIEPTRGEILVDGVNILEMARDELLAFRRNQASMVFQSFALLPHRSVIDNVAFGLEVSGVDRQERVERSLAVLEQVGLRPYAESLPGELSGGMQQRVGLARALATNPSVLLMDEAFSALDPLIRTEMQDELLRLQEQQERTVIFISHDLNEAMRIGDRVAILQGGRIVQIATPHEILHDPENEYVKAFFRDVDVTRILTARDVASQEMTMTEYGTGTGRELLQTARKMLSESQTRAAVVVGDNARYRGVITLRSLDRALDEKAENLEKALVQRVRTVRDSAPLAELFEPVASNTTPTPVLDKHGRLIGTITPDDLLRAMDRSHD